MTNEFIDRFGLVKTRRGYSDSGNGAVFSEISNCLHGHDPFYLVPFSFLWQSDKGVLWRTPENTYGAESHDNYLALAVETLALKDKPFAREVLWSAFKKFGFMQNTYEKGDLWKSWMGRFPHIWIVFVAAAYPWKPVRWLCAWLLTGLASLSSLNINDASGTQLQWLGYYAIGLLGHQKPMDDFLMRIWSNGQSMRSVMKNYYDSDHPTLDGFDRFSKMRVL